MAISKASAQWNGTLKEGSGSMKGANGFFEAPFTFLSRFEGDTKGTNPEELIGAAQAGCFSMYLSAQLTNAGKPPKSIATNATVTLGEGPTITRSSSMSPRSSPASIRRRSTRRWRSPRQIALCRRPSPPSASSK